MKNNKYFLSLLPVALIVLISGCIGSSGPVMGNGVTILNFEPDFSTLYENEDGILYVNIQNQGEEQANNIKIRIAGIDENEWKITPYQGSGGIGSGGVNIYDWGYLIPPNPTYGTEGESLETRFQITAPTLPFGIEKTYSPMVRVYYEYKTNAVKQITMVSRDELRRMVQNNQPMPQGSDTDYTAGPLSIDVTTGKYIKVISNPDIYDSFGTDYSNFYYFPITITVNNVGNGIVSEFKQGLIEPEDYVVKMKIYLPEGFDFIDNQCKAFEKNELFDFLNDEIDGEKIYLWKGQSSSTTCNIAFDPNKISLIAEDVTLKLELEYSYYTDATTSITVLGD